MDYSLYPKEITKGIGITVCTSDFGVWILPVLRFGHFIKHIPSPTLPKIFPRGCIQV
jgi:hypothetical protein